jgi:hypothetical protein
VMMATSFAAVMCCASAMKDGDARRSPLSCISNFQNDCILLSALHHAVSSGWEFILNTLADPTCKTGFLGDDIETIVWMCPIDSPDIQGALPKCLERWGVTGPEEIQVSSFTFYAFSLLLPPLKCILADLVVHTHTHIVSLLCGFCDSRSNVFHR